jgi:hypothetical protein
MLQRGTDCATGECTDPERSIGHLGRALPVEFGCVIPDVGTMLSVRSMIIVSTTPKAVSGVLRIRVPACPVGELTKRSNRRPVSTLHAAVAFVVEHRCQCFTGCSARTIL